MKIIIYRWVWLELLTVRTWTQVYQLYNAGTQSSLGVVPSTIFPLV
jgi:hypothetical protein